VLRASYPYPPECLEGRFSELRLEGVLKSSLPGAVFQRGEGAGGSGLVPDGSSVLRCPDRKLATRWVEAKNLAPRDWAPKGRGEPVVQPATA
jgi:hypothetical protein